MYFWQQAFHKNCIHERLFTRIQKNRWMNCVDRQASMHPPPSPWPGRTMTRPWRLPRGSSILHIHSGCRYTSTFIPSLFIYSNTCRCLFQAVACINLKDMHTEDIYKLITLWQWEIFLVPYGLFVVMYCYSECLSDAWEVVCGMGKGIWTAQLDIQVASEVGITDHKSTANCLHYVVNYA